MKREREEREGSGEEGKWGEEGRKIKNPLT
jgi:hypothetical protein